MLCGREDLAAADGTVRTGDVVMEVNGEQATYPNGHPRTTVAALLARAAARADTHIRLRLRRRQEPVEAGADDSSGDGTATQVTAAAGQTTV